MPYSSVTYTGDGTTRTFTIPFDYINHNDIVVHVNGGQVTAFDFPTSAQLRFDTAPTNGAVITLERFTTLTEPLVDFTDGSVFGESELDKATKQAIFLIQEATDEKDEDADNYLTKTGGVWDAGSYRLTELGTPTGSTDAATKDYVDTLLVGALADQNYLSGVPWALSDALTVNDYVKVYREGYGIREQAVGISVVLNQPNSSDGYRGNAVGSTEVLGGFDRVTPDINSYAERDQVAIFGKITSPARMATSDAATTVYTSTTVDTDAWTKQGGGSVDLTTVPVGVLIETLHSPKWTGIVTAVNPTTKVLTVSGWYKAGDPDGTTGTPANGTGCYLNPNSKQWAANLVTEVIATSQAKAQCGIEVGQSSTQQAWPTSGTGVNTTGIDVTHYGMDFDVSPYALAAGQYPLTCAYLQRGSYLQGYQSNGAIQSGFVVYADTNVSSPLRGFFDASDSATAFQASGGTHDWFIRFGDDAGTPNWLFTVDGDGNAVTQGLTSLSHTISNPSANPVLTFTAAGGSTTLTWDQANTRIKVGTNLSVDSPYSFTAEHLEVRSDTGNSRPDPYVDFSRTAAADYHVRVAATANNELKVTIPSGGNGYGYVWGNLRSALTSAGAPTGGADGDICVDTTNNRFYIKVGGTWKYAALT